MIAGQDGLAPEAQARAGSITAYDRLVCERSTALAADVSDVLEVPVFIVGHGGSAPVLIFKASDN